MKSSKSGSSKLSTHVLVQILKKYYMFIKDGERKESKRENAGVTNMGVVDVKVKNVGIPDARVASRGDGISR